MLVQNYYTIAWNQTLYLPCFCPILLPRTPGIPDHHWTGAYRYRALLWGSLSCMMGRYWRPSRLSRPSHGRNWMVYRWPRPDCKHYRSSARPELYSKSPASPFDDHPKISTVCWVMPCVLALPVYDTKVLDFNEDRYSSFEETWNIYVSKGSLVGNNIQIKEFIMIYNKKIKVCY